MSSAAGERKPPIGAARGALSDLRVLDLSDRFGYYAGKLFADMGADVILVEKPGGCALRLDPPFLRDRVDPACGILNYYNTSKRSLTLDLDTSDDQRPLRSPGRERGPADRRSPAGARRPARR